MDNNYAIPENLAMSWFFTKNIKNVRVDFFTSKLSPKRLLSKEDELESKSDLDRSWGMLANWQNWTAVITEMKGTT